MEHVVACEVEFGQRGLRDVELDLVGTEDKPDDQGGKPDDDDDGDDYLEDEAEEAAAEAAAAAATGAVVGLGRPRWGRNRWTIVGPVQVGCLRHTRK